MSCRDRAPFVFTSDMAYVINGGDKPSSRFHDFVDLCCEAYNLIRKHTHLFLNLLGLVRELRLTAYLDNSDWRSRCVNCYIPWHTNDLK